MPICAIQLLFWIAQSTGLVTPSGLNPAISATTTAIRVSAENQSFFDQQKRAPRPLRNAGKRAKKEAVVETLTGTVEWEYKPLSWDCEVPNCDHFALFDDATGMNFELDDARAALPFEGKRAKVTGAVDLRNSTVHVISIEKGQ